MKHQSLRSAFVCGAAFLLLASACSSDDGNKVASLDDDSSQDTETTVATDSREALLAYTACMRENGVDMSDPTFDADGNTTGGLFGPDSDIDPRSDEFQAAQEVCGSLLEGVQLGGGGPGGNFDPDQIQTALNDFTACLRDEGLEVDDISFGAQGGPGGGANGPPDGSLPPGGFGGGPPDGSAPGGPGGAGFDPTQGIIDQLGLDDTDPAVTAAIETCQPLISEAFNPPTGG